MLHAVFHFFRQAFFSSGVKPFQYWVPLILQHNRLSCGIIFNFFCVVSAALSSHFTVTISLLFQSALSPSLKQNVVSPSHRHYFLLLSGLVGKIPERKRWGCWPKIAHLTVIYFVKVNKFHLPPSVIIFMAFNMWIHKFVLVQLIICRTIIMCWTFLLTWNLIMSIIIYSLIEACIICPFIPFSLWYGLVSHQFGTSSRFFYNLTDHWQKSIGFVQ